MSCCLRILWIVLLFGVIVQFLIVTEDKIVTFFQCLSETRVAISIH